MSLLGSLAYRSMLRGAAKSTLIGRPRSLLHPDRGRFTEAEVSDLLDTVWRYERAMPARPQPEHGLRARTTLRLAGYTLAFLDALLLREVERDYAIELVADLTWKVGRWWGRIGRGILRGDPRWPDLRRLGPPPFSPCPAAGAMRPCMGKLGVFQVTTCPVAEFLAAHDAGDLCKRAWCDAVRPISEVAGLTLHHDATIAEGSSTCEVRWTRG
jgi:hypothetical protein